MSVLFCFGCEARGISGVMLVVQRVRTQIYLVLFSNPNSSFLKTLVFPFSLKVIAILYYIISLNSSRFSATKNGVPHQM